MTLRNLNKEDACAFREVRLLGLQESPTAFGASYAQEAQRPLTFFEQCVETTCDRWVIGAFKDESLIGVIGCVRDSGDKTRHKGSIWGMYVDPANRGQGIGAALLQDAINRLEGMPGLRRVRLSVVTSNIVALRLYEKFGFVCYGEEAEALCISGVFHSEFHMVREIVQLQSLD